MTTILFVGALFLLGMSLSWLFSGAETGFYLFSRLRLQLGLEQQESSAANLERLNARPAVMLAGLLVGNNLALELVAFSSHWLVESATHLQPEAVASVSALVTTPIVFLFCEAFPKSAFMARPYFLLTRFAATLRAFMILLWPAAVMVSWISRQVSIWLKDKNSDWDATPSKKGVLPALMTGLQEGTLTRTEHMLAANVLRLGQIRVESIAVVPSMLPQLVMPADPERWAGVLQNSEDSRALVYTEDGKTILGLVHAVDIAIAIRGQGDLTQAIRPLPEVPPKMPARKLVERLSEDQVPYALTRSGPNETPQLVRLQDLVEQVVGRIRRI